MLKIKIYYFYLNNSEVYTNKCYTGEKNSVTLMIILVTLISLSEFFCLFIKYVSNEDV